MPVRIRLARFGRKNFPFYRIFVADSRCPRDGRHLEVVGHFDPIPARDGNKHVGLNFDRIRAAGQAGILPPPPPRVPPPSLLPKAAAAAARAALVESRAAAAAPQPQPSPT